MAELLTSLQSQDSSETEADIVQSQDVMALPSKDGVISAEPVVPVEMEMSHRHWIDQGLLSDCPHPWRKPLSFLHWIYEVIFGLVSLILFLAIIAAIPVVNIYVLGYFLDVQGKVARTGKISRGFPLLAITPRLGTIVLGIWLFLWPIRILSGFATDAALIAPNTTQARVYELALTVLSTVIFIHLGLALARGGGWYTFLRPIKNFRWLWSQLRHQTYIQTAAAQLQAFLYELHLKEYYSLGLRGTIGGAIWILPPSLFLGFVASTGEGKPIQGILSIIGGIWLGIVLARLPALQSQFAHDNRLRSYFKLQEANKIVQSAPLVWLLSTVFLYVLMLPLYLFKVVVPPQDALWMVTLIFVTVIFPTKLFLGWSYYHSSHRTKRPYFLWRWFFRGIVYPLCWFYVFLLYFTQFIDERGPAVLYQNHAFLLPF